MVISRANNQGEQHNIYVNVKSTNEKVEKQEEKEQRKTIYAADTKIMQQINDMGDVKVKAQKDAMRKLLQQFFNDMDMEQGLKDIENENEILNGKIQENREKIGTIDKLKQDLMDEYNITEDSDEYKQLQEIEKVFSPRNIFTEKGSEHFAQMDLTEFQRGCMVLDGMKDYYSQQININQEQVKGNNEALNKAKVEMNKNDGMIGAVKEAEKILEDSSKSTVGKLMQLAVDQIDKKVEEAKEDKKKAEEKQEEKEKLIETSHETEEEKRTRKSNENIIDSSSEGEKDLTEIQNKLSKLAEENQMLEDDIKGILLDTSL